ncbi:MAG: adaptor protein MecA [Lachnospiraceae bacterium]|nr:adaptor protein MecA [Lachnospiraceae bacterium]
MKIEKLNENQIRCTLSKADLEDHNIRLTELAYGTDRAKALFRDMMQKASDDVGFEVGDIPLMIEAIPVNPDCLVLIVTKVEDPEELDTRFSKFTKPAPDDDYEDEDEDEFYEDTDEDDDSQTIFDMLDNIVENLEAVRKNAATGTDSVPSASAADTGTSKSESADDTQKSNYDVYRIFVFSTLDSITMAAGQLNGLYNGENSLFKNDSDSRYYLILNRSEHTSDEFNMVCNTLCEFGSKIKTSYAMPYHMAEHFQLIIQANALQTLGVL